MQFHITKQLIQLYLKNVTFHESLSLLPIGVQECIGLVSRHYTETSMFFGEKPTLYRSTEGLYNSALHFVKADRH